MNVDLTPRQAKILASIVKEYCETNEPVASKELVEKYDFAISGATVRNEMQAFEKMPEAALKPIPKRKPKAKKKTSVVFKDQKSQT
jgi:predicted transcriptional regulator